LTPDKDIWNYVRQGSYAGYSKWRDMDKIVQPNFTAPMSINFHARGNMECAEICKPKRLPRNAILVKANEPVKMYAELDRHWEKGHLGFLAHGTCQLAITKGMLKAPYSKVRDLLRDATLKCIDNVDNTTLEVGDILLTRIGTKKSVGKPHLILE